MGVGEGKGAADICPGILWAIIWFFLILLTIWLALFLAWFYVILLAFAGCFDCLKPICEALLKAIQLPMTCAENMVAMKPLCWVAKPRSLLPGSCVHIHRPMHRHSRLIPQRLMTFRKVSVRRLYNIIAYVSFLHSKFHIVFSLTAFNPTILLVSTTHSPIDLQPMLNVLVIAWMCTLQPPRIKYMATLGRITVTLIFVHAAQFLSDLSSLV